jgi:hypothetical protein
MDAKERLAKLLIEGAQAIPPAGSRNMIPLSTQAFSRLPEHNPIIALPSAGDGAPNFVPALGQYQMPYQGLHDRPYGAPPPTPPLTVRATPPALPNFQIPGLNTLAGGPFSPTQTQALQAPPQTPAVPPMPAPVPIASAPGMQLPASPAAMQPLPPPIQIGAAPGMGPQANPQLDEWRRALDAAQFARQGQ